MKNKILLGSVAFIGLATFLGVGTALLANDPVTITRMTTVSSIFGVGSIGLFFVGLAFPSEKKSVRPTLAR